MRKLRGSTQNDIVRLGYDVVKTEVGNKLTYKQVVCVPVPNGVPGSAITNNDVINTNGFVYTLHSGVPRPSGTITSNMTSPISTLFSIC